MTDLSNVGESLDGKPQSEAAGQAAWLAEDEIPRAAVTLLSGEPGSGKSFVACTLAAAVSQTPDARVMIAHSEPTERLHARLVRAGADTSRVALVAPDLVTDKSKIENPKSKIGQRLDTLIAWLSGAASSRRADLIVIDDLESWSGKALSAGELAEGVARLNELARMSGAAVLAVVRSASTTEGRVTARSLDRLMRAADVVWMVAADRELTGHRRLLPLKNNLAALPKGKTFQMVAGRVEWLNKAAPDDALAPGSRRSLERADRQTAEQWLCEALRHQDVPSRMLYAQARQCNFSRNTILRAAHRMGMHSHKSAFDGGWKYSLRDAFPEAVERYRPQPIGCGVQSEGSGFRVKRGDRVQRTGDMEGFGIQDSAFSMPAGDSSNPSKTAENVEGAQESQEAQVARITHRELPPSKP